MADMGDDDWKVFACAEAGVVGTPVTLEAGHSYIAKQIISKL